MEHPIVAVALDLPHVTPEARYQRGVERHYSTAGGVLETLFRVFIRNSDRQGAALDQHVSDPELCDLLSSGSGRQEESPAVEFVVVPVAVPAPPWSEDSL
jgi:hypothetical protein